MKELFRKYKVKKLLYIPASIIPWAKIAPNFAILSSCLSEIILVYDSRTDFTLNKIKYEVRGSLFSMYEKFSEKLTYLTP